MTPEQELMQEAVFADDASMRRLIKAIGSKISAATTAADIVKLRLLRAAVKAIGAARWGAAGRRRKLRPAAVAKLEPASPAGFFVSGAVALLSRAGPVAAHHRRVSAGRSVIATAHALRGRAIQARLRGSNIH